MSQSKAGLAHLKSVNASESEISFPQSDAVILMTKFIQHRWTETAYRRFPRERESISTTAGSANWCSGSNEWLRDTSQESNATLPVASPDSRRR